MPLPESWQPFSHLFETLTHESMPFALGTTSQANKKAALTHVHGIANKGNCHWKKNDTIQLRPGIRVFRKGHNCDRGTRQDDGDMKPGQKCTFIGKKDLRFHLDGDLSLSHKCSHLSIGTLALFLSTKHSFPKANLLGWGRHFLATLRALCEIRIPLQFHVQYCNVFF